MNLKTFFITPARTSTFLMLTFSLALVLITSRPYGDTAVDASVNPSAVSSSAASPETARSAVDFVNSIGVNTHLNYFDRQYGNFTFVARELQSIGIRHVRDGVHLQNDDYNHFLYGRWIELGRIGIRFDAVLDPRSNLGTITPALLAKVDRLSGHTIDAFEGPNELDISGMRDWATVDRNFQHAIYESMQSLPDRNSIKAVAPSLAFAQHAPDLGNMSDRIDEGNLHPYPAAQVPSIIFPEQINLARIMAGNKDIVITETGYHNGLNDHSDQPGVSETAAAKYIPRLYLEDFAHGITRTYLYEFLDESADPGLQRFQMHWGLIRSDDSEKPAFTALKNLIAELNDAVEISHPGRLAWSLNPAVAHVDHVLLQKSNGEFDLVVWQEVPSYNYKAQKDITDPPIRTVLTLNQHAQSIATYEPTIQANPMNTYKDVARIPLDIPDHPLVVRILLR